MDKLYFGEWCFFIRDSTRACLSMCPGYLCLVLCAMWHLRSNLDFTGTPPFAGLFDRLSHHVPGLEVFFQTRDLGLKPGQIIRRDGGHRLMREGGSRNFGRVFLILLLVPSE